MATAARGPVLERRKLEPRRVDAGTGTCLLQRARGSGRQSVYLLCEHVGEWARPAEIARAPPPRALYLMSGKMPRECMDHTLVVCLYPHARTCAACQPRGFSRPHPRP